MKLSDFLVKDSPSAEEGKRSSAGRIVTANLTRSELVWTKIPEAENNPPPPATFY
jgi:hypothetical protein